MMPDLQNEIYRLQLAAAATGAGIWDYDIDAERLQCDDRWHEILGLDSSDPVQSLAQFKPHIHPDDVERATDVHAPFSELTARGEDYRILYRIIRPDGEVRWIKSAACLIQEGEGRFNRAVGAIIDVTGEIAAQAALAESEQQFKTLADTVPQIIFGARPDGAIDYLNRRWREFTGAEDPLDDEPWLDFLHPDDRDRMLSTWSQSVEAEENYKAEFRYRHHSGEYRWMAAEVAPLRDDQGRVLRWFGSNTDIHAAKQLQAERELVARELDHRLKNVFAIIDSLIGLSARDDPQAKPYAERLRSKLTALASAHNLIWQAETQGRVTLQALLHTILKPYENDGFPRLTIRGANPEIGVRAITPLVLLFHELATNAVKYGALNSPLGKVRIDIAHTVDEVRIDWVENVSQPLPAPNTSSPNGFGSTLFAVVVERQLSGSFTHHLSETGFQLHLTLPPTSLQHE